MKENGHLMMILRWFKERSNFATLHEIINSGQPWAHEWNARKTDIRKRTEFDFTLDRGKRPSENLYRLVVKDRAKDCNASCY